MRLPQLLLDSPYFQFSSLAEFKKSLAGVVTPEELEEINGLYTLGLPPVSSRIALAAMFGISPGLVWSFVSQTHRYYRSFEIPKGKDKRHIDAPKVGLKMIQKWLSVQLQNHYNTPDHVFGFVANRSHIDAASHHCKAKWVFSVDIKNFFQTTPLELVINSLREMGFGQSGATLLGTLCCLRGFLAQGAPSSPILSNICFRPTDDKLSQIAITHGVRLTRYADDIVFSGENEFPEALRDQVLNLFNDSPWSLSDKKIHFAALPNRLKVHGLLVHGNHVRLTKGYRNRLRAYEHLLSMGRIAVEDLSRVKGHLIYGNFVGTAAQSSNGP